MRRMSCGLYLWPGLPQIVWRGSWSGLTMALTVGLLLDFALIGTFGWTELFSPTMRNALWGLFGTVWLVLTVYSVGGGGFARVVPGSLADDTIFREALAYYLKGDWCQAERLLNKALARHCRDVDCRLMLATLYRHTGRLQESAQQLSRLEQQEGAAKWGWEIWRERQLLEKAKQDAQPPESAEAEPSPQAA